MLCLFLLLLNCFVYRHYKLRAFVVPVNGNDTECVPCNIFMDFIGTTFFYHNCMLQLYKILAGGGNTDAGISFKDDRKHI
mmetsp:Transcript_20918/g.31887  ORF Transcript_20918/g.31887 Transcript_20918/m.31887 type:complete len:80 (+) Transcript_20918:1454-1693(+)